MAIIKKHKNSLPEPDLVVLLDYGLTRKHVSRLRFYFNCYQSHVGHKDAIDLDLIRLGAVNYVEASPTSNSGIVVTKYGAHVISNEVEVTRSQRSPHHDFASRLAEHLQSKKRLTWENIEFKIDEQSNKHARPDVYSVVSTHNSKNILPTVHEVKVSRADFLSDMKNPDKLQAYWGISNYLYYACPEGLIEKNELPNDCGLIYEMTNSSWKTVKRAKKKDVTLSEWHWMNLIMKRKI